MICIVPLLGKVTREETLTFLLDSGASLGQDIQMNGRE
jgi:hypothetical protein